MFNLSERKFILKLLQAWVWCVLIIYVFYDETVRKSEEFLQSCESFVLGKHSPRNPHHLVKPRSPKVVIACDLECDQERWDPVVIAFFASSSTEEGSECSLHPHLNQFKILYKYYQIKMFLLQHYLTLSQNLDQSLL